MNKIISIDAINRRNQWVNKIQSQNDNFLNNFSYLEKELCNSIKLEGIDLLIDHLRLCGNIPECYAHDSSQEKLYSKYTDSLLSLAYREMGLNSLVLSERADAADVEVVGKTYSFVADAKAFRLSRTAKNQKDFKVQAMDNWKKGKDFAMIVCPIYQLPVRSSQIYEQASTRNVCIFTYSHLSLLLQYLKKKGKESSQKLLHKIFKTISELNPSKDAISYWAAVNRSILEFSDIISKIWYDEKKVATEAIKIAKEQDLDYLASEREKIMQMSHQEALKELIKINKIENKIKIIKSVNDNELFNIK